MKHILAAFALCAIPAMAFGQNVGCTACSHQVSVYMGEGGFIATAAEGAEKVVFVASCGSVTTSGELVPSNGTVSMLMTMENGLACASPGENDKLQLGPVEDGGWYWITDDSNSAVGNLVAMDVLDNAATDITSAGPGVTITKGGGAVFLKETATGRVGILPNILAEPEVDPPETDYCDTTGAGTTASPYERQTTDCMLKDGTAVIRAQGPADAYTGKKAAIVDGGTVRRPIAEGAMVAITYDLWSAGGQYVTAAEATGRGARLGHSGGDPLSADFAAAAASGGPQSIGQLSEAGLTLVTESENVVALQIEPNTSYCNSKANPPASHSVTVTVTATATAPAQMTPPIKDTNATADGVQAATHKITVVCPPA